MKKIEIYEFQLKNIQDALRVTANIHGSRDKNKEGRTCHDRMVTQAEKYADNAMDGKIDERVKYI